MKRVIKSNLDLSPEVTKVVDKIVDKRDEYKSETDFKEAVYDAIYNTVYSRIGSYQSDRPITDIVEDIYNDQLARISSNETTSSGQNISSIKCNTWMGKYRSVSDNRIHKVYFESDSSDFDEAQNYFEDIIPEPFSYAKLLGEAPSRELLEADGFTKIECASSDNATWKSDKRLGPNSERYKGYLIVMDRGGDGYNVYNPNRELEDCGYANKADARKCIDDLIEEYGDVTASTKLKRISRYGEFDNGKVMHDWTEMSDSEAEDKAKQMSIENPDDIFYVAYDDVMDSCSDTRWINGESYSYQDVCIRNGKPYIKSSELLSNIDQESLKSELWNAAADKMKMFGYDEDEVADYLLVDTENHGDKIRVELRAELSYDDLTDLLDVVDPIVAKYSDNAYFEPVQPGIAEAYIYLKSNVSEPINSSYGGAFDIDPNSYFTKDDIVEFGESVCDKLSDKLGTIFDISNVYTEGNDRCKLTLSVICNETEEEFSCSHTIDMRKIRKPSDLIVNYSTQFAQYLEDSFRNMSYLFQE